MILARATPLPQPVRATGAILTSLEANVTHAETIILETIWETLNGIIADLESGDSQHAAENLAQCRASLETLGIGVDPTSV